MSGQGRYLVRLGSRLGGPAVVLGPRLVDERGGRERQLAGPSLTSLATPCTR